MNYAQGYEKNISNGWTMAIKYFEARTGKEEASWLENRFKVLFTGHSNASSVRKSSVMPAVFEGEDGKSEATLNQFKQMQAPSQVRKISDSSLTDQEKYVDGLIQDKAKHREAFNKLGENKMGEPDSSMNLDDPKQYLALVKMAGKKIDDEEMTSAALAYGSLGGRNIILASLYKDYEKKLVEISKASFTQMLLRADKYTPSPAEKEFIENSEFKRKFVSYVLAPLGTAAFAIVCTPRRFGLILPSLLSCFPSLAVATATNKYMYLEFMNDYVSKKDEYPLADEICTMLKSKVPTHPLSQLE